MRRYGRRRKSFDVLERADAARGLRNAQPFGRELLLGDVDQHATEAGRPLRRIVLAAAARLHPPHRMVREEMRNSLENTSAPRRMPPIASRTRGLIIRVDDREEDIRTDAGCCNLWLDAVERANRGSPKILFFAMSHSQAAMAPVSESMTRRRALVSLSCFWLARSAVSADFGLGGDLRGRYRRHEVSRLGIDEHRNDG